MKKQKYFKLMHKHWQLTCSNKETETSGEFATKYKYQFSIVMENFNTCIGTENVIEKQLANTEYIKEMSE